MEKVVEINNKKLVLRSSLYSIINYRHLFGSELFDDVKKIEGLNENNISEVIEVIFRIVYVLTNPKKEDTFIDFVSSFDLDVLSNPKILETLSSAIVELLKTSNGEVKKADNFR